MNDRYKTRKAAKPNWPITMVYQDVKTGEIWSRGLLEFLERNEQVKIVQK